EIVPNLHYGINAKEWWIQALPNANNISPLYPLRVGKKIIGFEDQKILKELLTDVSFQSLLILLDKISIGIFKIGFSSNEE
ncbi:10192_t:CDS:2, partial [Entrophospora sp. SA101]